MLNARDFLAAVLTNLRPLFDNFGTKRAFAGKVFFMDFLRAIAQHPPPNERLRAGHNIRREG